MVRNITKRRLRHRRKRRGGMQNPTPPQRLRPSKSMSRRRFIEKDVATMGKSQGDYSKQSEASSVGTMSLSTQSTFSPTSPSSPSSPSSSVSSGNSGRHSRNIRGVVAAVRALNTFKDIGTKYLNQKRGIYIGDDLGYVSVFTEMNSHIKNFFEHYTDDLIKYIKSKEDGVEKDDIKIQGFLDKLKQLNSENKWVDFPSNENWTRLAMSKQEAKKFFGPHWFSDDRWREMVGDSGDSGMITKKQVQEMKDGLLSKWLKEEESDWRTINLEQWNKWKTTLEGDVGIFNQKQSERFILWILKMCLNKFEEKLINIAEVVDTDEDDNNGINHIVKYLMREVLRLDGKLHSPPGKKGGKTRKRKRKARKGKKSKRKGRKQSRHKARKGKRRRRRTKKH